METEWSLRKFLEPLEKPKVIYRSETNGIAERTVRRIKEGTSSVLLQLQVWMKKWWADSTECHCYLRNIQDLLSDGKTPIERRFGETLQGSVIPFGSMMEYHPISAKDQSRLHQFGKKVFPGIFFGHALHAGGIWRGDILVADIEELEKMDASEIHARRLKAQEVITPKNGEHFIFPIADRRHVKNEIPDTIKFVGFLGVSGSRLGHEVVQVFRLFRLSKLSEGCFGCSGVQVFKLFGLSRLSTLFGCFGCLRSSSC